MRLCVGKEEKKPNILGTFEGEIRVSHGDKIDTDLEEKCSSFKQSAQVFIQNVYIVFFMYGCMCFTHDLTVYFNSSGKPTLQFYCFII